VKRVLAAIVIGLFCTLGFSLFALLATIFFPITILIVLGCSMGWAFKQFER